MSEWHEDGIDDPARVDGLPGRTQAETPREKRARVLGRGCGHGEVSIGVESTATALATDAAELEDIGILQEEVPLLGKEETEASEVDLPIIDFGR